MKRNCWVVMEDEVFAQWELILAIKELPVLREFTKEFLKVGEKHEMFLLSADDHLHQPCSDYLLYLKEIDRKANATSSGIYDSIAYLNYLNYKDAKYFFFYRAGVYCYNENGLVEKFYLSDAGKILREKNPVLSMESNNFSYAYPMPPLLISVLSSDLKKGIVKIWIQLKTDLFFPRIGASHQICKQNMDAFSMVDNSELSYLNVANLNEWIKELHLIASQYNGKLNLSTTYDFQELYAHYLTQDGIDL